MGCLQDTETVGQSTAILDQVDPPNLSRAAVRSLHIGVAKHPAYASGKLSLT